MAKFWTVRTGRSGERTEWGFANGVVGGGWHEMPDLTGVSDKEQLRAIVADVYGGSRNVVASSCEPSASSSRCQEQSSGTIPFSGFIFRVSLS
jgi:predicted Mrr-cat superfamily restriction endonuclease